MTKNYFIILCLITLLFTACGNKEPEYIPGMSIKGIRAPMTKILFSPLAYDHATVAVEGIALGVIVEGDPDGDGVNTIFKLADLQGNYINVIMPGEFDLADDDYLIVGGLYKRNGNLIEAEQIEKVVVTDEDREEVIKKGEEW